jgi:hypothetical protein
MTNGIGTVQSSDEDPTRTALAVFSVIAPEFALRNVLVKMSKLQARPRRKE